MTLLFTLELQTYDDVILRLQKAKNLSIEDEILDQNNEKELKILGSKSVHSLQLSELAKECKLFKTPA